MRPEKFAPRLSVSRLTGHGQPQVNNPETHSPNFGSPAVIAIAGQSMRGTLGGLDPPSHVRLPR